VKPTEEESFAVNATIKALDKLEREYLKHPELKVACRAARATFTKALADCSASPPASRISHPGSEA